MGNWDLALESAQQVLEVDKYFVKAIYVKAEALYNTCNFEHALIYYHRGQVIEVIGFKKETNRRPLEIGLTWLLGLVQMARFRL